MQDIHTRVFDWEQKKGSIILNGWTDASMLQWPPGYWADEFTVTCKTQKVTVKFDPASGTAEWQKYTGWLQDGRVVCVTVFND